MPKHARIESIYKILQRDPGDNLIPKYRVCKRTFVRYGSTRTHRKRAHDLHIASLTSCTPLTAPSLHALRSCRR